MSEAEHGSESVGQAEMTRENGKPTQAITTVNGTHSDVHVHKLVPQLDLSQVGKKLYGREEEESALLQVYQRVCRSKEGASPSASTSETKITLRRRQPEFVCITGASGQGKTSLANSLNSRVTGDGGYFISGKFDLLERNELYAPFVSAFTEFSNLVVAKGDAVVSSIRDNIRKAIGSDTGVLLDMIPALGKILGSDGAAENSSVARRRSQPNTNRFSFVFRSFLRAVCSSDRPIVLLLDDLHWADQASLDLLQSLVPDPQHESILFVATSDDEDIVSTSSRVHSTIRRLSAGEMVETTQIRVAPIEDTLVFRRLLSDILLCTDKETAGLADRLSDLSGGNMLYAVEIVRFWHDEGFLTFDERSHAWSWDDDDVRLAGESESLRDLIAKRILRLPPPALETLKVAACLGATVDVTLLQTALSGPVPISEYLSVAASKGLLNYASRSNTYSFPHDVVQATAYSLISDELKPRFHATIGRKLTKKLESEVLERNIYVILDQFYRGSNLLDNAKEKNSIASLCLDAGSAAVLSSSFKTASVLLRLGLDLVGDAAWKDNYYLILALSNSAAEVAYCTGDFDRVDELTGSVITHATEFRDKLRAYSTDISALAARDQMSDAIDLALTIVAHLGVSLPSNPSRRYVSAEIRRVKRLLKGKSNEMILRIAPMADEAKISVMQILNLIFVSAYMACPPLSAAVTLCMVRLSLEYGLTAISSAAFSFYGILLCSSAEETDGGFRFGQLALALLEQYNTREWIPRVYAAVYGCIYPWSRRLDETVDPLRYAIRVGLETGDMEFSMLNAAIFCFNSIDSGGSLECIEKEASTFLEIMVLQKQEGVQLMLKPFLQMVENFTKEVDDPTRLSGSHISEKEALDHALETNNHMSSYAISFQRATLSYVFGDFEGAWQSISRCRDVFLHPMANFEISSLAFFDGLIAFALALQTPVRDRGKYLAHARSCIKKLRRWALASPINLLGKLSLLQAENAAVQGKHKRAYLKYVDAIAVSAHAGFLHEEAIANERTGRYLLAKGDMPFSLKYMRESHRLYKQWGAQGKAKRLQAEISERYLQ